jgi:hypothetical protein
MTTTLIPSEVCEDLFAFRLGFSSFDAMMDVAEPVYSAVGRLWFVTRLPNHRWLASPVNEYDDLHQFPAREAAREFASSNVD